MIIREDNVTCREALAYTVGVNIKFPFTDHTVLLKNAVPFYSAGRDAILLLYAIRI